MDPESSVPDLSLAAELAAVDGIGWLGLAAAIVLLFLAGLALQAFLLRRNNVQLQQRLEVANTQLDGLRARDPLTGLVMREELEQALTEMAHACDRGGKPVTVLYLGLDNLAEINHSYGMAVGDQALVMVAQRLSLCVHDQPQVSRVGGREFALLLQAEAAVAIGVAGAVLQRMQETLSCGGHELQLSASIGLATYPEHGSLPRLLAHAGLAMSSARLAGGGAYSVFDTAMAVNQRDQLELVRDLRRAVERGELQLVYQPKIDAASLQVTAAEALLRWHHPTRGLVSPALFIPLAERHGLISTIGDWVIEEACRQAAAWRDQGLRMRVAINLSNHQMRQTDLVQRLADTVARHGLRPHRITCEITETVAMEDAAHTREAFEQLRRAGLHVSIDDFGTGHSSLAVLRRLPAEELKIDRSFVNDLATSADARRIVQAIIQMAHSLSLRVVAEGVETEDQRDLLLASGVDEMQGYLFAKPMSAASLALWAADDERSATPSFRPSLFSATDVAPL
jgi:diguanylate cyclase (GGDEF)-like protein